MPILLFDACLIKTVQKIKLRGSLIAVKLNPSIRCNSEEKINLEYMGLRYLGVEEADA
jgi:hypothetical protein